MCCALSTGCCALLYPLPTAVLNQLYFVVAGWIQLFSCHLQLAIISGDSNIWSMTEYSFTIKFNCERGWELDSRWRGETSISKNPLKIVSYFICGCPGCISSSELYQVKGLSWQASLLSDPNIWNISSKFQPLNFLTFSNKF